jgi:hypothetical protein
LESIDPTLKPGALTSVRWNEIARRAVSELMMGQLSSQAWKEIRMEMELD